MTTRIIIETTCCKCRCTAPPRPARVTLARKEELPMDRWGITLALPPVHHDTETRELTITTNGVDPPQVLTLPKTATESAQLEFNEGDTFVAVLVDIDDAGNRSPASAALSVNVNDDVTPPQPGELGVASKVELPDAPDVTPPG